MAFIFLVGGSFEGQKEYAEKHYPEAEMISDYHLTVKRELEEGKDPILSVKKLMGEAKRGNVRNRDTVLISDEIGCGIIPLTPEERKWREYNGRVNCLIAAEADQVIRIIAGIPQRIK